MNEVKNILKNKFEFLNYLKSKFPLIHNSNLFFRDLHYGIMSYLIEHNKKINYTKCEKFAEEIGLEFEKAGIFKKIDNKTWMLNYPEFALPRKEKKTA